VRLNIRSVKCVGDNQSAVRSCKRKSTESIFHRTESDYAFMAKITNLQGEWCNEINIKYAPVRGHANSLDREKTREERAKITADELCDIKKETATGIEVSRPNVGYIMRSDVHFSSKARRSQVTGKNG
jgi:hypothetical protein